MRSFGVSPRLELLWLQWRHALKDKKVLTFLLGGAIGVLTCALLFVSMGHYHPVKKSSPALASSAIQNKDLAIDLQEPFNNANQFLSNGQCERAIPLYQSLLSQLPQNPNISNNLAICYSKIGKIDEARTLLESTINRNDSLRIPHDNLTRLYAHMADLSYRKVKPGIDIRNQTETKAPTLAPPPNLIAFNSLETLASNDIKIAAYKEPPSRASAQSPPAIESASDKGRTNAPPLPAPTQDKPSQPINISPGALLKQESTAPLSLKENTRENQEATPKPPAEKTLKIAKVNPANKIEKKGKPPSEERLPNQLNKQAAVQRAINDWARAWSGKKMNQYFDSYAKKFQPSGNLSHESWRNDRIAKITGKKNIRVELSNIKVSFNAQGNLATVHFTQFYKGDDNAMSARKTIQMTWEDGRWKILEENVR